MSWFFSQFQKLLSSHDQEKPEKPILPQLFKNDELQEVRNNTYIHDILIKVLVDLLSGLYVSTILIIFRCTTLINRTVTEEKNGFDQGKSRMFSSKLVFYWHRVVTLNDKLLVDKGLLVHRNPKHKIKFAVILKSAKDLLLWYWVVWYLGTSIMVLGTLCHKPLMSTPHEIPFPGKARSIHCSTRIPDVIHWQPLVFLHSLTFPAYTP